MASKCLVVGLFLLGSLLAGAAEAPKSAEVQQAQKEYEAAIAKAQGEMNAARETYLAKLDAALKQVMQAGDLEEANRIDAVRKAVRSGMGAAAAPLAAAANASAEARQKPGWVVGRITDSAGKPISGVTFEVSCFGTTIKGGEKSQFRLEVDEGGNFAQEVPDGLYAVTAYVEKDFAGSRFRMQLHPVDNKPEQTKVNSKPGIVKDFVWKLSETRPGLDPKQPFANYGGSVRVYDAQYLGEAEEKLAAKFGKDASVTVTLTPKGPLIDGSKGSAIEIKAPLSEMGNTLGHTFIGVPYGPYSATVTVNGKALKVSTKFRGPFEAAADFEFKQASVYDSVQQIQLYVSP